MRREEGGVGKDGRKDASDLRPHTQNAPANAIVLPDDDRHAWTRRHNVCEETQAAQTMMPVLFLDATGGDQDSDCRYRTSRTWKRPAAATARTVAKLLHWSGVCESCIFLTHASPVRVTVLVVTRMESLCYGCSTHFCFLIMFSDESDF